MGGWENVKQLRLLAAVAASDDVRQQFTTLFDYGVFDKFPPLKIVVLESGTSWIGYWLDRIDAVFTHTFIGDRVPLKHKPSDYFVLNVSTFATSLPLASLARAVSGCGIAQTVRPSIPWKSAGLTV